MADWFLRAARANNSPQEAETVDELFARARFDLGRPEARTDLRSGAVKGATVYRAPTVNIGGSQHKESIEVGEATYTERPIPPTPGAMTVCPKCDSRNIFVTKMGRKCMRCGLVQDLRVESRRIA